MGEIRATVTLENRDDRAVVNRGFGVETDVRRMTVEGIETPEEARIMMTNWLAETDPEVLAEAALAKAQALMSHAMEVSPVTEKHLAMRMEKTHGSVDYLLSSESNLTVRTLGEFLAICGYRLEITTRELSALAQLAEPDEQPGFASAGTRS